MNTSLVSNSSVPIGFRSFAEEDNNKVADQSFLLDKTHGPQEISFAESQANGDAVNDS